MDIPTLAEFMHLPKEIMHVVIILIVAWIAMLVSRRLIRLLRNYMNAKSETAEENDASKRWRGYFAT